MKFINRFERAAQAGAHECGNWGIIPPTSNLKKIRLQTEPCRAI